MFMLRELRKQKGITMKELGNMVGVAESTISQYETEKRAPDYETLLKFGEIFDVSIDYILRGSIYEEPKQSPAQKAEEELSVDERVEQLMSGLSDSSGSTLMLDGEPASPEAIESLRGALKQAVETARAVNKARRKD